MFSQILFGGLALWTAFGSAANVKANADACYGPNLISVPSGDHRPVPWGTPSVHFSSMNGTLTTCCDSLDEIRTALDEIDNQLLDLLNRRAAYVREATRFKSTRASVNVPSRNEAVLEQAEQQAVAFLIPILNDQLVQTNGLHKLEMNLSSIDSLVIV
ncbi:Chorismate mutase, type II [Penicillium digitatum]|uniref:Chorismate mutase, type II n=1 Tax=Penicillium digitatum TaxID=36651 RepID=A0A7T6XLQ3_PENDI|nr:Chorismate mutase, type II [Penicillium digitatum]